MLREANQTTSTLPLTGSIDSKILYEPSIEAIVCFAESNLLDRDLFYVLIDLRARNCSAFFRKQPLDQIANVPWRYQILGVGIGDRNFEPIFVADYQLNGIQAHSRKPTRI